MEAKDTVMRDEQIIPILNELRPHGFNHIRVLSRDFKRDIGSLLKVQAEISFKAGIREVVEWGEEYRFGELEAALYEFIGLSKGEIQANFILIPKREWQAKLKEWGVD